MPKQAEIAWLAGRRTTVSLGGCGGLMDIGIAGRTAVVLGSTSGLGWAVAQGLAREGANVVVTGRRDDLVKERAATLPSAVGVTADLTDPDAPATIVQAAREAFGEVDILVLNGGGPSPSVAEDLRGDDVESAARLLVRPHVELVRAVLPQMRRTGWGRIVAVGSTGVQQPIPNLAASNVGRAALAGYLKSLAGDVAADGVTVNMVLPGRIDTDRVTAVDRSTAERTGRAPEEVRRDSEASIPVGRYGAPEELAAVVVFLAGDTASYVTGEQVRCDGGLVRAH
jgi:3-oxoacyl-[acyl-carrier protein] reductase